MKLFICGKGAKGRSVNNNISTGKDLCADYFKLRLGLKFIGSSQIMCKEVIWPMYKDKYLTWQDCFLDRHSGNMRKVFFDIISEYNKEDPCRLSKLIFSRADIYVGIRNKDEFLHAKRLADLSIWIDASKRIEVEDNDSCSITADMCDITVHNNGSLQEYYNKLDALVRLLS